MVSASNKELALTCIVSTNPKSTAGRVRRSWMSVVERWERRARVYCDAPRATGSIFRQDRRNFVISFINIYILYVLGFGFIEIGANSNRMNSIRRAASSGC